MAAPGHTSVWVPSLASLWQFFPGLAASLAPLWRPAGPLAQYVRRQVAIMVLGHKIAITLKNYPHAGDQFPSFLLESVENCGCLVVFAIRGENCSNSTSTKELELLDSPVGNLLAGDEFCVAHTGKDFGPYA